MTHLYFINRIIQPISGDVINIVTLSTWQYAANTKQTKSQQKTNNVMITLQKYQEKPLKIIFCFQTGDKIVIYVFTRG